MGSTNYGIQISGRGNLQGENIAVGENASISLDSPSSHDSKEQEAMESFDSAINILIKTVENEQCLIENKDEIIELINDLREMVEKRNSTKKTNESKLKIIFQGIKDTLEPATAITGQITILAKAIKVLVGIALV